MGKFIVKEEHLVSVADSLRAAAKLNEPLVWPDGYNRLIGELTAGFKTVDVDIPMGRMKGDIDGDGQITQSDYDAVMLHQSGGTQITDEIALWCADSFPDDKFDTKDYIMIMQHMQSGKNLFCNCVDKGVNPDYYNNWNYYKIDDLNGYFYHDIPVEGMTANSTAFLVVYNYADCFEGVECLEGIARIKANRCPITACTGYIIWEEFEQVKSNVVVPMDLEVSETGLVTATAGAKTIIHQIPDGDEVSY